MTPPTIRTGHMTPPTSTGPEHKAAATYGTNMFTGRHLTRHLHFSKHNKTFCPVLFTVIDVQYLKKCAHKSRTRDLLEIEWAMYTKLMHFNASPLLSIVSAHCQRPEAAHEQ